MKKGLLLLSCSFLFLAQANATENPVGIDTASEHLKLVKDTYEKKFEQMDANSDGSVTKEEYLKHQFEEMREVVLTTSGFEDIKEAFIPKTTEVEEAKIEPLSQTEEKSPEKVKTLDDFSATLEEMASFDLDFEEELSENNPQNQKRLTKEDVMPDFSKPLPKEEPKEESLEDASANIEELLKEDTELEELISKTEKQLEEAKQLTPATTNAPKEEIVKDEPAEEVIIKSVETAPKELTKEDKINQLIEDGKKNLPQKIDDITTWTDVFYKDNMIIYNYSVNMDVSVFSQDEMVTLQEHIKKEACLPIYIEKCPEFAPVFIKDGTNVKINYIDRNGKEISFCELNRETCN